MSAAPRAIAEPRRPNRAPDRTIVVWTPDWPVTAARAAESAAAAARTGAPAYDAPTEEAPLALLVSGVVFACSPGARAAGVRRGLLAREAQSRCPGLAVLPYDPGLDSRAFEPVVESVEAITPGVQVLRPGLLAVRARGPARFYGGEEAAATALLEGLDRIGLRDVRIGIADGPFAAEQAARLAVAASGRRFLSVPPGESAGFLAPLPLGTLVDSGLAAILARLGVRTLRDFAALPAVSVRRRFGVSGALAHAIAAASDDGRVVARVPPAHRELAFDLEPPLDRIDPIVFTVRAGIDVFVDSLAASRLVCTVVSIEITTETGSRLTRTWRHPRWFSGADVVDRTRWQLQGSGAAPTGLSSAVTRIRIVPERVDSTDHHERGLWDSGPDERIDHALTRVQGLLGPDAVLTPRVAGGRLLADRRRLVPWGEAPPADRRGSAAGRRPGPEPWPGSLAGLSPATVFVRPPPVAVLATDGAPVSVDARGAFTAEPARFTVGGPDPGSGERAVEARAVTAWAGPWPVRSRWWDPGRVTRVHRLQIVDAAGVGWLLCLGDDGWRAEGRYD